jgi:hypothetical protein
MSSLLEIVLGTGSRSFFKPGRTGPVPTSSGNPGAELMHHSGVGDFARVFYLYMLLL